VYALDATIVDLCLSVFPWARYRRRDAAIKLHTLLDLRGLIPTVVQITEGKRADVTFLDDLIIEPGAIYIMDRGDAGRSDAAIHNDDCSECRVPIAMRSSVVRRTDLVDP